MGTQEWGGEAKGEAESQLAECGTQWAALSQNSSIMTS